jgi:hypothetical protein
MYLRLNLGNLFFRLQKLKSLKRAHHKVKDLV